ncbi:MAG: hypothetical protein R2706_10885 [Acidimicrobiales bacterium]
MKSTPNAKVVLGTDPVGAVLGVLIGQDLTALLDGHVTELLFDNRADQWFAATAAPGERGTKVLTIRDVTSRLGEIVDPVTNLRNMRDLAKRPPFENTTVITYRLEDIHRISGLLGKDRTDSLLAELADRVNRTVRVGIDRGGWRRRPNVHCGLSWSRRRPRGAGRPAQGPEYALYD